MCGVQPVRQEMNRIPLVMALSKHIPLSNIHITATDLDKQVLQKAQVGLYNEKSIANVPPEFKCKYFKQIGKSFQISDEIKRCVTFKEHNLLKDPYPRDFDMILCRNVVISVSYTHLTLPTT